jgi:hypothetical protein
MEVITAFFGVLSQHMSGGIEENHEKPRSGYQLSLADI